MFLFRRKRMPIDGTISRAARTRMVKATAHTLFGGGDRAPSPTSYERRRRGESATLASWSLLGSSISYNGAKVTGMYARWKLTPARRTPAGCCAPRTDRLRPLPTRTVRPPRPPLHNDQDIDFTRPRANQNRRGSLTGNVISKHRPAGVTYGPWEIGHRHHLLREKSVLLCRIVGAPHRIDHSTMGAEPVPQVDDSPARVSEAGGSTLKRRGSSQVTGRICWTGVVGRFRRHLAQYGIPSSHHVNGRVPPRFSPRRAIRVNLAYCESLVHELERYPLRISAHYDALEAAVAWLEDPSIKVADPNIQARLDATKLRATLLLQRWQQVSGPAERSKE